MVNNKFEIFLGGIFFIFIGIFSLYGIETPSKISGSIEPSVHYGIGMIFIGSIFLLYGYLVKIDKEIFSICHKCKETYTYKDLQDGLCPSCNIKTIDIEKYYKDKKDTISDETKNN